VSPGESSGVPDAAIPDAALPGRELRHLLGWFVRIRWLFVAALAFAILVGAHVFRVEFPVGKTIAVCVAVFSYNALLLLYHLLRRHRAIPVLTSGRGEAGLQIGLDLLALTALIHFVGGAESPLVCLYLIHAIAAGMLLPKREAWVVGAVTFGLFLSVVVLEYRLVLPQYHLAGMANVTPRQQRSYETVLVMAFLVTLFSAMSITSAIMGGLRFRERQLMLTQEALVRQSEVLQQAYASLSEKQMQLVQTEKQASLGRLVAGIAHEINNPIQFIHGNMAVLSEAFSDVLPLLDERSAARPQLRIARLDYPFFRKQVPVLLKDMADGAERIGSIVRDLKTFARRDEGRLDEDVDLAETVRASLRLLHNQLKRFRVEEDLDPHLPPLRGNLSQLQQVVVNTLQNAYQALADDGQGRITIRTRVVQGGSRVRLSIEDNGCGIPPDLKERIFDPFFTTKQSSGGTGLGLAITEGIIEQHQGQIQVESQLGKGTTFHFILPVKGGRTA
jgi:signal transduction histidine kinase